MVAELASYYDQWWDDVSRRHGEITPLHIGAEEENPVQLGTHDWIPPMVTKNLPWNQPDIRRRAVANGTWYVRVARSGRYAFTLRERPAVAAFPLPATEARLQIGDHEPLRKEVPADVTGVRFELPLEAGDSRIKTWLIEPDGTTRGAYYVDVEYLSK